VREGLALGRASIQAAVIKKKPFEEEKRNKWQTPGRGYNVAKKKRKREFCTKKFGQTFRR